MEEVVETQDHMRSINEQLSSLKPFKSKTRYKYKKKLMNFILRISQILSVISYLRVYDGGVSKRVVSLGKFKKKNICGRWIACFSKTRWCFPLFFVSYVECRQIDTIFICRNNRSYVGIIFFKFYLLNYDIWKENSINACSESMKIS